MWDDELLKTYKRKYHDKTDSYIRNAVKESIESLIGSCEVQIATDASGQKKIKVTNLSGLVSVRGGRGRCRLSLAGQSANHSIAAAVLCDGVPPRMEKAVRKDVQLRLAA